MERRCQSSATICEGDERNGTLLTSGSGLDRPHPAETEKPLRDGRTRSAGTRQRRTREGAKVLCGTTRVIVVILDAGEAARAGGKEDLADESVRGPLSV